MGNDTTSSAKNVSAESQRNSRQESLLSTATREGSEGEFFGQEKGRKWKGLAATSLITWKRFDFKRFVASAALALAFRVPKAIDFAANLFTRSAQAVAVAVAATAFCVSMLHS